MNRYWQLSKARSGTVDTEANTIQPETVEVLFQTIDHEDAGTVVTVWGKGGAASQWFEVTTLTGTTTKRVQAYPEMKISFDEVTPVSVTAKEMIFSETLVTTAWEDIVNKPATFPPATHTHVMADITDLSLDWSALTGKPSYFPADLTDVSGSLDAVSIGDGTVDNTVFGYLTGVTSGVQAQLNNKTDVGHVHSISDITLLSASLSGKANSSHTHAASDIASGTLPVVRGGTGVTFCTTGDLLYASGSSTFSSGSPDTAGVVAKSGNQTSIAGTKAWTGVHTFGAASTILGDNTASGFSLQHSVGSGSIAIRAGNNGLANMIVGRARFEPSAGGSSTIEVSGAESTISLGSGSVVKWGNSAAYNSTKDLGLERDSAGVLEITDGSTGTRDLKLRNLIHTGTTVGFYNVTPVTRPTVSAAATDAATTQTLVNELRTALINNGLVQ